MVNDFNSGATTQVLDKEDSLIKKSDQKIGEDKSRHIKISDMYDFLQEFQSIEKINPFLKKYELEEIQPIEKKHLSQKHGFEKNMLEKRQDEYYPGYKTQFSPETTKMFAELAKSIGHIKQTHGSAKPAIPQSFIPANEQIAIKPVVSKKIPVPDVQKDEKLEPYLPELGKIYAERLAKMPSAISQEELDRIVDDLLLAPYTQALNELAAVILTKAPVLTADKKTRVCSLLAKSSKIYEKRTLYVSRYGQGKYRARVVKIDDSPEYLARDIGKIGTCQTSKDYGIQGEDIKQANWFLKDSAAGGCVILFGEEEVSVKHQGYVNTVPSTTEYDPKVFTRLYVALSKSEEPVLFIDTIEPGHIGWSYVKDWTSSERGRELLYSLASAVYTAQVLGIDKVAFGEREANEFAGIIGFKEEELFCENSRSCYRSDSNFPGERKIGYPTKHDGTKGPYAYKLDLDSQVRVAMPSDIARYSPEQLLETLDNIESCAAKSKLKKNKQKADEISLYLDAIQGLNSMPGYNCDDISSKVSAIRTKYLSNAVK